MSAIGIAQIAENPDRHYRRVVIKPELGKRRVLQIPSPQLKAVQRAVLKHVLETVQLPADVRGGVKKRSAASNAAAHVGKRTVVKMDLRDFFPSIRADAVEDTFLSVLRCDESTAVLLTDLTTFRGSVPQGAPTSSAVANLAFGVVDDAIRDLLHDDQITYTRYVDDLTFSGDLDEAALIVAVAKALSRHGFRVNRKKCVVMRRNSSQIVTGYAVNTRLAIAKNERRRIRAKVHKFEKLPAAERERSLPSILGSITRLKRTNNKEFKRLTARITAARKP